MESQPRIHPRTGLGAVHLVVADLHTMISYYTMLGLKVHSTEENQVKLGAGSDDLLVLVEDHHAVRDRSHAGLFHFALLVPARTDLARVFYHIGKSRIPLGGVSDHAVSEALYLSDPEGNGIEIYRDRPRREWTYPNGVLRIVTEPLDVDSLWAEGEQSTAWNGFPEATIIGHIHLQVGQLAPEERFYEQILGFEHVARYGAQATFVSAGGYHHHIGMNTWRGPLTRRQGALLGLHHFTIALPTSEELATIRARLDAGGIGYTFDHGQITLQDPMGIGVVLQVEA